MSKTEKQHYNRLSELGCVVCLRLGYGYTAPEIHHPRKWAGMGQKSAWHKAIPLCVHHHRGGWGVGLHGGQKEFEKRYGTEQDLLDFVYRLLGVENETDIYSG